MIEHNGDESEAFDERCLPQCAVEHDERIDRSDDVSRHLCRRELHCVVGAQCMAGNGFNRSSHDERSKSDDSEAPGGVIEISFECDRQRCCIAGVDLAHAVFAPESGSHFHPRDRGHDDRASQVAHRCVLTLWDIQLRDCRTVEEQRHRPVLTSSSSGVPPAARRPAATTV